MATVIAQFDGRNFVPEQPVNVPVGTKVTIVLPQTSFSPTNTPSSPHELTAAERAERVRLMRKLEATEPYFPTVEDAIGYSRKYPGYYP